MDDEQLRTLLKDEYIFLQSTYENYERTAMLIKGWSVTLSLGGVTLGIKEGQPWLLAIACLVAILFWILEAIWFSHQDSAGKRVLAIESFFRRESKPFAPMQIWASYRSSPSARGSLADIIRKARMPIVCLPHVVVVILTVLVWVLFLLGVLHAEQG